MFCQLMSNKSTATVSTNNKNPINPNFPTNVKNNKKEEYSTKCVDLSGENPYPGSPLISWDCTGTFTFSLVVELILTDNSKIC